MTNAHEFLDEVKDVTLEEEEMMVSFNVTALLISIDLDQGKKITKELLQNNTQTNRWKQTIYELLEMCLHTCFKFNADMYE